MRSTRILGWVGFADRGPDDRLSPGHYHLELGSAQGGFLRAQFSVMALDNAACDRESEAGSWAFSIAWPSGDEGLEQSIGDRRRNARSAVLDRQPGRRIRGGRTDAQDLRTLCVIERED